jgi:hypothetical protein
MSEKRRPSPVSVTTPTMIPAAAQVAATFNTPSDPASRAWAILEWRRTCQIHPGGRRANRDRSSSALSRLRKLTRNAATVAQNAAAIGVQPSRRKTTMASREKKWKPIVRVSCQAVAPRSITTFLVWCFRASISTISSNER